MLIDTHAHLFWRDFEGDFSAVLARARAAGVEHLVLVGTDVRTSLQAVEMAALHPEFSPTAGVHPHDAASFDEAARATIRELCQREQVLAVGESGLDWFKEYSPRAAQLEAFAWHARLSKELDKPLIVHCRDAFDACFEVIAATGVQRGVFHCFTGGQREAERAVELGFHLSFSGVVTYPKNTELRAAAAAAPAERILVETDCPFLPPQSARGRRNEPALLRETAECLAQLRGSTLAELAALTSANARALFRLPS